MSKKSIEQYSTQMNVEVDSANNSLVPSLPMDERFTTSRHGYKLEIRDSTGTWLSEIKWPDDNGHVTTIKTSHFFTGMPEVDHITSALLHYLLRHYVGDTINGYGKGIGLITALLIQGKNVEEAVSQAILDVRVDQDLTAIKALSSWFIAYELDGYDYDFHAEVMKLSRGEAKNSYVTLFTFDAELGPFVREEMLILQRALYHPYIHLEDRVILGLCIFFGLRPIQISLLKQSDFIDSHKLGISYLKVPRVKQKQATRRTQFIRRVLSDQLAQLIRCLIETHRDVHRELEITDPPLIMRRTRRFYGSEHPYVFRAQNWVSQAPDTWNPTAIQPYQDLYDASNKQDKGHHLSSHSISWRLQNIARFLPESPRTCMAFHLTAYRFRYTVGTNAVMEGKTEPEVMDLLDHSHPGSVKHYFRYTHEMNEILDESTNKRIEQRHFVAAWRREGDQTGNIYGEEIVEIRHFTTIGKCHKGSVCMLEPAVACYQCDRFCPSKDTAAHHNALEHLMEKVEELRNTSTGAAIHQLDEAVAGCKAAIAYSAGEPVFHIDNNEALDATQRIENL